MPFGLMPRHALASLLAVSLLLAGPSRAHAQAGWRGTPDELSPRGAGETRVDLDAAGNAVAVWSDLRLGLNATMVSRDYDAATRQWSATPAVSSANLARELAMDGQGHAVAIGLTRGAGADTNLAYRHDRATGQWQAQPVPTQLARDARVAMDPAGIAVVCWSHPNGSVHCSRFTPATGAWAPEIEVDAATALGDLVMDGAGVAHVIWVAGSSVRTAQFDPSGGTWSAPHDLAVGLGTSVAPEPRLAVNATGQAVATWTRSSVLEASRYAPGSGWSAAVALSVDGTVNGAARAAVDGAGGITVAWAHEALPARTLQIARFAAGSWSAPVDLSPPTADATGAPAITADAAGNVHLLWRQIESTTRHLVATKYAAATGQWSPLVDVSGPAADISGPDVALDSAGGAMAVWAQDFSVRALRWTATPVMPAISAVSPAPSSLTLTFALTPGAEPALAIHSLEYSLDGGTTWAATSVLASPLTIAGLEPGATYDVRLRAVNSTGASPATGPLAVKAGTDATLRDLRVVARDGATLTLAWRAPDGVQPLASELQGGLGPGDTLATLPLTGTTTAVTLTLPTGTFYLRVAGRGPLGVNTTSNEIRVAVGTGTPPAAPSHLLAAVDGSTVQLSWTNVVDAGVPTSLTLHVSGDVAGAAVLPVSETLSVANVPAGTYTLALTAANDTGTSAPSVPITITVPATCAGAPSPPEHIAASVSSGVVTLAWDPPASGPAVSSYQLLVSGDVQAVAPTTARVLTGSPPPGRYVVRVAAVNSCGVGAASAPVIVVVP